jgi:hypothetical protein
MSALKGFTKAPNKLLFNNSLTPISKLVMVGLSYYDRGRGCFAKRTTLAAMLNVSMYQLRKAIQELLDAELIVIHRRGYGKTSIIRVLANTPAVQASNTAAHKIKVYEEEEIEEEFVPKQPEDSIENNTDTQETPQDGFSGALEEPTAPTTIPPIPQHHEGTQELLRAINERIRPQSFNSWFKGKIAISYEDDEAMTIRCLDRFIAGWLEDNYTALVEGIVNKKVAFHGKERYDAKEDEDRHSRLEC